jgi:hypothetical protein
MPKKRGPFQFVPVIAPPRSTAALRSESHGAPQPCDHHPRRRLIEMLTSLKLTAIRDQLDTLLGELARQDLALPEVAELRRDPPRGAEDDRGWRSPAFYLAAEGTGQLAWTVGIALALRGRLVREL